VVRPLALDAQIYGASFYNNSLRWSAIFSQTKPRRCETFKLTGSFSAAKYSDWQPSTGLSQVVLVKAVVAIPDNQPHASYSITNNIAVVETDTSISPTHTHARL